MKHVLLAIVGLALLSALSACNTMRGVGQDVSGLGRTISSASGR